MEAVIDARTYIASVEPRVATARVEVRDLALSFGGQRVLDGIDLDVRPGELVLLRGENGSGKTTLLNVLSGFARPDRGSVRLHVGNARVDACRETPERMARLGVGRLWQDIRLFPTLSVLDNVLAATPSLTGQNPWLALAAFPQVLREERAAKELALKNLERVGLRARASSSADMLSVGQMKRVALARLLQMDARFWLLDEPLAGLDVDSSAAFVRDLDRLRRERNLAILVVEHKHDSLRSIADRTLFLRHGRLMPDGAGTCPN